MRAESVEKTADIYLAADEDKENWNLNGLRDYYSGWLLTDGDLRFDKDEFEKLKKEDVVRIANSLACDMIYFLKGNGQAEEDEDAAE